MLTGSLGRKFHDAEHCRRCLHYQSIITIVTIDYGVTSTRIERGVVLA